VQKGFKDVQTIAVALPAILEYAMIGFSSNCSAQKELI